MFCVEVTLPCHSELLHKRSFVFFAEKKKTLRYSLIRTVSYKQCKRCSVSFSARAFYCTWFSLLDSADLLKSTNCTRTLLSIPNLFLVLTKDKDLFQGCMFMVRCSCLSPVSLSPGLMSVLGWCRNFLWLVSFRSSLDIFMVVKRAFCVLSCRIWWFREFQHRRWHGHVCIRRRYVWWWHSQENVF